MSFSDGTSSCLGVVEKRTHQVLPVSEYRFLAAIILALLGIVSPTHAAAMPAPATRYVYCEFTVFQAPTIYFSDTFGTSEPSDLKVNAAFANYMSQKSPARGAASCQTEHDVSGHGTWQLFDSLSQAEAARKSEEALLSNKTNKRQIIETGWRYGAAQPTATAPAASSTTSDPQVAADPRLKSMSAEDRQYILDQGAYAVEYCKNNATLNGLYSCSCFSEKMVDARIKTNGERVRAHSVATGGRSGREPFTNLVSKVDYRDCADPAKAEKYGSDRAYEVLKMDTQLSRPQIDQISACVGSSLAGGFKANPVPNIVVIDGMFNSALVPCREKAVGGGSSASAPQASSNQTQPAAQSPPQTAVGQPVPAPQPRSILDRLNQARNRANDAIHGTTGTNPPQSSNQSPQSAPAPSGVTSQQPNATAPSPSASSAPSSTSSAGSSGRLFYHFCRAGGATRIEGYGTAQLHRVAMPWYMSDIYAVPMYKNINHADGVAFNQFLGEKYDFYFKKASDRNCNGNDTSMEAAQARKQKSEDELREIARRAPSTYPNSNVIETGWKWTGAEPSQ